MWVVVINNCEVVAKMGWTEAVAKEYAANWKRLWPDSIAIACQIHSPDDLPTVMNRDSIWPLEAFLRVHKQIERIVEGGECAARNADRFWHFTRPYVCVIHEPTKRGYYLDRGYNLICSVENILRPGLEGPPLLTRHIPHETEFGHQAAATSMPIWAENYRVTDFTTYWLY
jgi:hypothetical protein